MTRASLCVVVFLLLASVSKAYGQPANQFPLGTNPHTQVEEDPVKKYIELLLQCIGDKSPSWCETPKGAFLKECVKTGEQGYSPRKDGVCPEKPFVRQANGLGPAESKWLRARKRKAKDSLRAYFRSNGMESVYNLDRLLENSTDAPGVGLAFSGGGYRAMLNGAGVLQALDSKEMARPKSGYGDNGAAGLLQSSLYITGLSGGGWLTGTWALNEFPAPEKLRKEWTLWPKSLSTYIGVIQQCKCMKCETWQKEKTGFPTSHADYWTRAVARQILPNFLTKDISWSSIAKKDQITKYSVPLPILVSTGKTPTDTDTKGVDHATVYETSPFEFGSWDPDTTFAFTPTEMMGTSLEGGALMDGEKCVNGFDSASFIMGTSTNVFDLAMEDILPEKQFKNFTVAESAANVPNFNYRNSKLGDSDKKTLYLADGMESLQNIPLLPHLRPERRIDLIIASDFSSDLSDKWTKEKGYNYPDGSALIATYNYAKSAKGRKSGIAFPKIPSRDVFLSQELNYNPTFFGCDSADTTLEGVKPPIVVYLPNGPYTSFPNCTDGSTITRVYWPYVVKSLFNNGYRLGSQKNVRFQRDDTPIGRFGWGKCLACAVADRARERKDLKGPLPMPRSTVCKQCFEDYCYDEKKTITPQLAMETSGGQGGGFYNPQKKLAAPDDGPGCFNYVGSFDGEPEDGEGIRN